jgi:hypothetical protein
MFPVAPVTVAVGFSDIAVAETAVRPHPLGVDETTLAVTDGAAANGTGKVTSMVAEEVKRPPVAVLIVVEGATPYMSIPPLENRKYAGLV